MIAARNFDLSVGFLALFVMIAVTVPPDMQAQQAPAVSVHQLRQWLGNPNVIVVDVRLAKHYYRTRTRIPGAYREEPGSVERWAWKFPKNKTIVFY